MTAPGDTLLDRLGRWLAGRLQDESSGYEPYTPSDAETLRRALEPGDILLIDTPPSMLAMPCPNPLMGRSGRA